MTPEAMETQVAPPETAPSSAGPTAATDWQPAPPPTDLIFDDGEPLESNRHRIAMNALIRSAQQALAPRTDYFIGGNMFVYYSQDQALNRDYRGPDFFVALGVDGSRERQGWVVWQEDGRYPDVIVELLSPSTANQDRGAKKDIYERIFKTADYFIYDPFAADSLEGWHLESSNGYQPLVANERGWLWCQTLGLWLGTWEGQLNREPATGTCAWLRFYDGEGTLVPLPEEAAEDRAEQAEDRAEQAEAALERERQKAALLAARLQELGVDPGEFSDLS